MNFFNYNISKPMLFVYIIIFIIGLILDIVSGRVAKSMGRSFWGWFLLSHFVTGGIITLLILWVIQRKNKINSYMATPTINETKKQPSTEESNLEVYEQIARYKKLYEDGVISEDIYKTELEKLNKKLPTDKRVSTIELPRKLENSTTNEDNKTLIDLNAIIPDAQNKSKEEMVAFAKGLLKEKRITNSDYVIILGEIDKL